MVPRLLMEQSEMFRAAVLPLSIAAIALAGCAEMAYPHISHNPASYKVASVDETLHWPTVQDHNLSVGRAQQERYLAETSAERQQLAAIHQDLVQQAAERAKHQGPIRNLSNSQCDVVRRGVPQAPEIRENGGRGPIYSATVDNKAYTPQEEYCRALGRSTEGTADNRFPGFMPDGAWSTYDGNGHYTIHYR